MCVLTLIIFSSFNLYAEKKRTIDITENGETETVKTHANTVGELLKEQELIVGEHDWLSHDMDANIENGMEIRYKEAEKVIITIDGVDQEFFTTREVITDLLQDEGLAFSEHDDLSLD